MLQRAESIPATAGPIPHPHNLKFNGTVPRKRNAQKQSNHRNIDASAKVHHRHSSHTVASASLVTSTRASLGSSSFLPRSQRSSKLYPTKKNTLLVMSTLFLAVTSSAFFFPSTNTSSSFLSSFSPPLKIKNTLYDTPYTNNGRCGSLFTRASVDRGPPFIQGEVDVRIAVVAPLQEISPLGPNWGTVLPHIAERLTWSDSGLQMRIVDANNIENKETFVGVNAVVALGIKNEALAQKILSTASDIGTFTALGSVDTLTNAARIAGVPIDTKDSSKLSGISGIIASIQAFFLPSARTAQRQSYAFATMRELYSRHTSDDLLFSFLVLVNEAERPVGAVSNSTKRTDAGIDELKCMVSNCGTEMFNCFTDSTCRTALDCMNECAFNDQVCTYRCIASYESSALEAFSLCIIQKHNCLGLTAEIPAYPNPPPMTSFQGETLTHELAEGLFVGWLEKAKTAVKHRGDNLDPFSWRVFAGKNPAYDYFPCQYQLFYPGKARGSFWYQPVFKVLTLDGRKVWRQRLYRVRRDTTPGTFFLSVLDNGVTSSERWTIVDCDEELDWCIFYYRGAASAAGMTYTGAVLTSRSGDWPTDAKSLEKIELGLDKAGIKMWELSTVSNEGCDAPPLNLIGPTPTAVAGIAA